ncbi:MAG: Na+/H+ antiporter [Bacteroidota bacterium]|nr:Na+/H+ antiporter [Bacteroidota bacterium]
MHYNLLLFLVLLSGAFLLIIFAQKLKISYPLFLVLAGLAISYIPGIPIISIDPDMIFLIFLPPLLYEAAWYTSWNDFIRWKRAIGLLSFGLVICTSVIVAFAAYLFIPGFTLPLGFLLGGIIAPPDAIAAASVLKNLNVPRRVMTILEGESLINDASSLIIFRFAMAAVITGEFSFHQAALSFLLVTVMGIAIGLAVAQLIYLKHKYLPTTANIDAAFTLVTPYFMYLAAEQFHFSGVMAVVSGGLYLSHRSHDVFISGQTRLQTVNVWSTLVIMLNALVFILIGLELPVIIKGMQGYSLADVWLYGLMISGIVIVVRFLWIYPATFIPRWLFKSIRNTEANPGWKGPFVLSWAGMRGVVSLAAALSIPSMVHNAALFPLRNLIIFITFVVILVTLVLQGFTLPFLIGLIHVPEIDPVASAEKEESAIVMRLIHVSLKVIDEKYFNTANDNRLIISLRNELQNNADTIAERLGSLAANEDVKSEFDLYNKVLREIHHLQRQELNVIRSEREFSDAAIRKQEIQIDLAEAKLGPVRH